MIKQQQQQATYVIKDQSNQKNYGQNQKRSNNNQNNLEDKNGQNSKKQNKFVRRSNSQEKQQKTQQHNSQQIIARAQMNQPQNFIYDSQTLISAFIESATPPEELLKFIEEIPHLFNKNSQKPQIYKPIQNCISDDEEPEWMQANQNIDGFNPIDIEVELEKKRVEYQISHGTFDKKQEEKQKKQNDNINEENSLFEIEKEKYIQLIEQEQKQQAIAQETQAKLQELFNFSQFQQISQDNKIEHRILSVEEVEKQALQGNQQNQIENKNDQQKGLNTSQDSMKESDDLYEQLEKMGIQIRQPIIPLIAEPIKITMEKISQSPFSLQAQLNSRALAEKLWFYVDNKKKVQGGFSSEMMDQWYQQKYLKQDLKVSWEQPGKWVALEQFMINLDLIGKKKLDPTKAMEPVFNVNSVANTQINNLQQLQQMNTFNINGQFQFTQLNGFQSYQTNNSNITNNINNINNINNNNNNNNNQIYQNQQQQNYKNKKNNNQNKAKQYRPQDQQGQYYYGKQQQYYN